MQNSKTLVELHPLNGNGFDYIPFPSGRSLTPEEIDKVAHTMYNRFVYEGGMPVWKDDMAVKIREALTAQVKQVLDALHINKIKVHPNVPA